MKKLIYFSIFFWGSFSFGQLNWIQSNNDASKIYDIYIGETISNSNLANGWRMDDKTGSNKQYFHNPFPTLGNNVCKANRDNNFKNFYFIQGEKYNGYLIDSSFTAGIRTKMLIVGHVINGLPEGKFKIFMGELKDSLNNRVELNFESGEVVGNWSYINDKEQVVLSRHYLKGKEYPQFYDYWNDDQYFKVVYFDDYIVDSIYAYSKDFSLVKLTSLDSLDKNGPYLKNAIPYYNVIQYYENGRIKEKGREKHHITVQKVGSWVYYDENGGVIREEFF